MGRTFKGVIDQAKALDKEGYTQKEISEKLHVSPTTVRKYLAPAASSACNRETAILFESFFNLLVDFETLSAVGFEETDAVVGERAFRTAQELFKVNKSFAQKILDPYLLHLRESRILDLTVSDDELDEESLQARNRWLALLKTEYAEKLVEFL